MQNDCFEVAIARVELVKATREEWKEWNDSARYAGGKWPNECDADKKEQILKCKLRWALGVYQRLRRRDHGKHQPSYYWINS